MGASSRTEEAAEAVCCCSLMTMAAYRQRAYRRSAIPRTSLMISSTIQARKKKRIMVRSAMTSSDVKFPHQDEDAGRGAAPDGSPCTERPSAFRIMVSRRSSAAIMAGEEGVDDSTESSMVDVGMGGGRWVDRSM